MASIVAARRIQHVGGLHACGVLTAEQREEADAEAGLMHALEKFWPRVEGPLGPGLVDFGDFVRSCRVFDLAILPLK